MKPPATFSAEKNPWLSEWSPHSFTEEGFVFKTAAHFIACRGAFERGDDSRASELLLGTASPTVKEINDAPMEVLMYACLLKLMHHHILCAALVATHDSKIEGHPETPRVGEAWMRIREDLQIT
jgi:predicted NAD-dependent protein-ADP-ribosyltransferase YbiA (DUF1768 family)